MPHYPPYTTTVVGAHSVPRWYEALDRLVILGQLAEGDLADAQLRASQAAILEQEIAGIDVITGGEMHRRRHNRHSPPNAMLNHFWQKLPSFQGETKPKPITRYDPNVFHPAAICRGPIADNSRRAPLAAAGVDRDTRGGLKASDHAPTWIVLAECKKTPRREAHRDRAR